MKIPTWDEVFSLRKENKDLRESLLSKNIVALGTDDASQGIPPDYTEEEKLLMHIVYDSYHNNNSSHHLTKKNKEIKELFKSIIGSDKFLNLKTGKKY